MLYELHDFLKPNMLHAGRQRQASSSLKRPVVVSLSLLSSSRTRRLLSLKATSRFHRLLNPDAKIRSAINICFVSRLHRRTNTDGKTTQSSRVCSCLCVRAASSRPGGFLSADLQKRFPWPQSVAWGVVPHSEKQGGTKVGNQFDAWPRCF